MTGLIYRREPPIAYVTVARPKAYNALNSEVIQGLKDAFQEIEADAEIAVVVVTGSGDKAFVAGADVGEIRDAGSRRPEMVEEGLGVLSMIRDSSKVVIAAVNGYALGGGCELAMCCDIRVASENARFGLPEAKLGLMPGYGGTQLLPRFVGAGMAKYLMFSGESVTAQEALRIGLVEKVCPAEALAEEAATLATKIAANGPLALRAIKRAVNAGMGRPIGDALPIEQKEYRGLAFSQDAEEGMASFFEKRAPAFRGI